MKIKYTIFGIAIAPLMFGCMAPYVPLKVDPTHPGNREAEEATIYPVSTTLDKNNEELTYKDKKQKSVHVGHNMDTMGEMDMGGMNHDSK